MNSYVLKNKKEENEILLYQEKVSYSFTPKKKQIKKVTILDSNMLSVMWDSKLNKEYNRVLNIIYSLITSDDTTSGDVLIAYSEIDRIREYLDSLEKKGLTKDIADKYTKKLYVLELELKKVHVMELNEEITEGISR